jgi:DNA ligase-associated metallophosphoesterase
VVSDLHFEKGSSFARKGLTLPPYDTRATLQKLEDVLARVQPEKVIALGDSFHDQAARERLASEDAASIQVLTSQYEWTWVIGNHDPQPPTDLGGKVAHSVKLGALSLAHEPSEVGMDGEVIGHFHPCAAFRAKGRRLRRPCFASDGAKLIMPAFGAYTGGLNILDPAYDGFFVQPLEVWLLGREDVYKIARRKLLQDPGSQAALRQRA